jgi:hypothetical protein
MASVFSLGCLCGRCFRPVGGNAGGFILSCSDFVCGQCSNNGCITSCPACGKQNVQVLDLSNSLPEEVQGSISDPVSQLEALANTAKFQIKYYKQTIRKLLAKVTQLGKENVQLKRCVIPRSCLSFAVLNFSIFSLLQQRDRPTPENQASVQSQRRGNFFEGKHAQKYHFTSHSKHGVGPFRSPHFSQHAPPATQQARPCTTQSSPAPQSQSAEVNWGFGLPPSRAAVTPAPVPAPPQTQASAPAPVQGYSTGGGAGQGGGSPAKPRPYTSYTTPSNLARPPSAQVRLLSYALA